MSEEVLNELIEGCKAGERRCQHKLYNLLAKKMYGVCLRYAKDSIEAEDILQDGFIKVFTKMDQFSFSGSFEGWVRRIMVNTALEYYRRSSKMHSVGEIEEAKDEIASEEIMGNINAQDLIKLIQSLPVGYKTVFNLYAIEGYSHKEIAGKLEITESTSKSQFSRAKVALQGLIKQKDQSFKYGRS